MILVGDWRPFPDDPRYEVSEWGQIRKRINVNHPERRQYLYLKPEVMKSGHLRVTLNGERIQIHRLVYRIFVGPLVDGLVVCHKDNQPANCHFGNLLQDTQKINMSHKLIHGTAQLGQKHPRALYSDELVTAVKLAVANAPRSRSGRMERNYPAWIAEQYGVGIHLVHDLTSKPAWKHV